MAIQNQKQNQDDKNKVAGYARPSLVVRNEAGEIVETLRFGKDIAVFAGSRGADSMIAHFEKNPEHVYEVQMGFYIPKQREEGDLVTF